MKRIKTTFHTLAALFVAVVATTACSSDTDGDKTVYSITTTGSATFESQKAIVRFNFQDKSGRPISAWNVYSYALLEYDLAHRGTVPL